MAKYKITIEYDGSNYVGWQIQDNGLSIQELIEKSIFKLTGEKTSIFGAGRTDAGVHALGQVAHFDMKKKIEIKNIRDGLNQYLRPHPIAILNAEFVDKNFHSRFSAKTRTYKYIIINRRAPLTINKNKSWGVFKSLNLSKMIAESKNLIGKNNLQSFRSVDCQSSNAIKTIDDFIILKKNENIIMQVSAKSFLHSQVRIMVGTLVEIGKGNIKKTIKEIIKAQDRSQAGMTAPACGLYLEKIDY